MNTAKRELPASRMASTAAARTATMAPRIQHPRVRWSDQRARPRPAFSQSCGGRDRRLWHRDCGAGCTRLRRPWGRVEPALCIDGERGRHGRRSHPIFRGIRRRSGPTGHPIDRVFVGPRGLWRRRRWMGPISSRSTSVVTSSFCAWLPQAPSQCPNRALPPNGSPPSPSAQGDNCATAVIASSCGSIVPSCSQGTTRPWNVTRSLGVATLPFRSPSARSTSGRPCGERVEDP